MSRAPIGPKTSKRLIRELVFFVLWLSGFPKIIAWWSRKKPRVLVFHGFFDDRNPSTNQPVNLWVHQPISLLERQLNHLKANYQSVSTEQIQRWLNNEAVIPNHAVEIHMDDGLRSIYKLAAPLFEQHRWTFDIGLISTAYQPSRPASWEVWLAAAQQQFPNDSGGDYFLKQATRFIRGNTDEAKSVVLEAQSCIPNNEDPFLLDTDMERMNWEEINSLQKRGFGLMNHTQNHEVLNKLSNEEIKNNLVAANNEIYQNTGISCNAFVYPTGVVDERIANAVAQSGFPFAYSLLHGMIDPNQPRQILPRIGIPSDQGYYEFVCRVAGVHTFFLSLKNKP